MSCIFCSRRSPVPVPFGILYGNPVSNRDNKLTRRTGGEILLPLSPIPVTCISGVRSSRMISPYGLEQWPANAHPQGAGLCHLPKRSCVGWPLPNTILLGSVFLQVTCWHWLLRCCCPAGAPSSTQSANVCLTKSRNSDGPWEGTLMGVCYLHGAACIWESWRHPFPNTQLPRPVLGCTTWTDAVPLQVRVSWVIGAAWHCWTESVWLQEFLGLGVHTPPEWVI